MDVRHGGSISKVNKSYMDVRHGGSMKWIIEKWILLCSNTSENF